MLYLDKILAQLAYPLGFSLVLTLLALLLFGLRRRRWGAILLTLSLLWLGLWSLPVVSDALRLSLEGQYPRQAVTDLPTADAVVVLGGGITPAPPDWPYPDLGRGADRVWHAARIYRAGKASRVIISGGRLPWLGKRTSEATAMRQFLSDLGVPPDAVLIEEQSRSTYENAQHTAQLLQRHEIDRKSVV